MKKRVETILLFTLVISLFVEILAVAISWSLKSTSTESLTLNPDVQHYTSGYQIEGTTYTPVNDDPQLGFTFTDREIQTILIEFSQPLEQDIGIQVYYASNNENLTGENFIDATASAESKVAVVHIPGNLYTHIRLDINGAFHLDEIHTSNKNIMSDDFKTNVSIAMILIRWAFLFIVFLIVSDLYAYFQEKKGSIKQYDYIQRYSLLLCQYWPVVVIGAMGILILLQINNSSMRCYDMVIPNNIAAVDMTAVGVHRYIRSDEFLVDTSTFFHNILSGNLSILWESSDTLIESINNIITMLNPYYWGRLYLPPSYAFSWEFVFNTAITVLSFYGLFYIITKDRKFSILAAFMLLFSPGFQWWSGPGTFGVLCGVIVLFYEFFEVKKTWMKLLCCAGLVCIVSIFMPRIYPAWVVPLVYLYIFVLAGIYATEKRINFCKRDIPYIGITTALMLVVVLAYFISQGSNTEAILETVYPGKRFHAGGGLLSGYWANYLVEPFATWKELTIPETNLSEISSFLHLFPISLVLFFAKYKDLKNCRVITSLFCFNLICIVYMVFGIGDFLAKYSLMSYTTPERLSTVWGFASFILLLLECYYIVPCLFRDVKSKNGIGWVVLNVCVITFLIWVVCSHGDYVSYMGVISFSYVVITLVILANLLFFGRKKAFLWMMCLLTIVSGVIVNPINFGTAVMEDTPLAQEIRRLDSQEQGRWIVLDNLVLPKYVYAQGVDCLNWLSWPPRFDLFRPLDEDGEFYDIYNRYAHIVLSLSEQDTTFQLNYSDNFSLSLNINDLAIWDVKYIVKQGEIMPGTDLVQFELLYHDELDNINIYEVIYA